MSGRFKKIVSLYMLACQGTIAIAFGLMAPMLIAAIGVAMDTSQAYLVRQRLHGAIDASALAAAATSEDEDEIIQRVRDFLIMNYPPEKIGILNEDDIDVTVTPSEVHVVATATYPTTFMRIMGYQQISVASAVTVAREIKGLEVVLVLDNTGSLDPNSQDGPNTNMNIKAVRTAARSFVNILFSRAAEPDDIKIGIVPYSSSVNVGYYGLGLHGNGAAGYGTPFVTLPAGISYNASHTTTNQTGSSWNGCVVEHKDSFYNSAATHVTNSTGATTTSRGQLWSTGAGANATRCMTQATCRGHGWDPYITSNDSTDDVDDDYDGPWDIYSYGRVMQSGTTNQSNRTCPNGYTCNNCYPSNYATTNLRNTCRDAYCFCSYQRPNEYCPYASVMPLTSDQAALINHLRDNDTTTPAWDPIMRAHGATYSNLGMLWGMRMLSPDEPFIEGVEWGDEEWNKAIVLMTDGEMSPGGDASGYWMNARSTTPNSINNLNDRLLEICEWLKEEPRNVIIYTVTFAHSGSDIDEDTQEIYRECASEPKADHYFNAPSQAQLNTAFERISGALSNLHLKK